MSQGTLYVMEGSPIAEWLREYVKEVGLDIKCEDCRDNERFTSEFSLHKAPAFIDSQGFKLTENVAIINYLTELANTPLGGTTLKERAHVTQWLSFINFEFFAPAVQLWLVAKTKEQLDFNRNKMLKCLDYIETDLGLTGDYLVDGLYTVADIYAVHNIRSFASMLGGLDQYPNINRWIKKVDTVSPTARAMRGSKLRG